MGKNTCGGCTFCCLAMAVTELDKPKDRWCPHAKKGVGCGIYPSRPQSCQDFECLWLQTDWPDESMRPDRAKVMFIGTHEKTIIVAHVHKDYPNAWNEGRVKAAIEKLRERYHVIIVWRNQRTFLGGKADLPANMAKELMQLPAREG